MSAVSARVVLSPSASRNLQNSRNHSAQAWGRIRAREYLNSIRDAFAQLASNPELGRRRPEVAPAIRSCPSVVMSCSIDLVTRESKSFECSTGAWTSDDTSRRNILSQNSLPCLVHRSRGGDPDKNLVH